MLQNQTHGNGRRCFRSWRTERPRERNNLLTVPLFFLAGLRVHVPEHISPKERFALGQAGTAALTMKGLRFLGNPRRIGTRPKTWILARRKASRKAILGREVGG